MNRIKILYLRIINTDTRTLLKNSMIMLLATLSMFLMTFIIIDRYSERVFRKIMRETKENIALHEQKEKERALIQAHEEISHLIEKQKLNLKHGSELMHCFDTVALKHMMKIKSYQQVRDTQKKFYHSSHHVFKLVGLPTNARQFLDSCSSLFPSQGLRCKELTVHQDDRECRIHLHCAGKFSLKKIPST